MKREYDMIVTLKERMGKEVFNSSYRIALWDELVNNKNAKEHGFLAHSDGLATQLKINTRQPDKLNLKKRQIYTINYGMNTGSEINGIRPSIIYKNSTDTL